MFQLENDLLPEAFQSFSKIASNEQRPITRAVTNKHHLIPTVNTHTYGSLSIKNICINDWNNFKRHFPSYMNENLSITTVKTLYKNNVFGYY